MPQEIKANFSGGLDLDTSYYALPPNVYVNALNITRNAVDGSQDNVITNIRSNRAATYTLPAGTNKCIGAYGHQLRGAVIYFVYNSNGYHSVLEFTQTTRVTAKIFESKTDSATIDILNFTENEKITSVNIYPRNEGDLLFFLDSLGRPTEMDINKFKAGFYTPVTRDIIDKGKIPPALCPQVVFDNDTSRHANNFRKRLVRLKYRWKYDDYETSTFSPISQVPLPVNILDDTFTNVVTNNNVVRCTFNSGGANVKSIEIAMSYVEGTNVWSDFQSVQVVEKASLVLSVSAKVITTLVSVDRVILTFSGLVQVGTVINVYLTTLPSTQTLAATYTTVAGDKVEDVLAGLLASATTIGISTPLASGSQLVLVYNEATYAYDTTVITQPADLQIDNIDFAFDFYNDSTYPNIDVNESILLFDYIPDIANCQDMPNGNVLAYAGITEGYDRDLITDVTVTVDTVAASAGGSIGSLSVTTSFGDSGPLVTKVISSWSGLPATGTVVNYKLKRKSDNVILTAASYTSSAGEITSGIVAGLNNLLNLSAYITDNQINTPNTVMSTFFSSDDYEFSAIEIIAPSSSATADSIASWKWSTERNIGIAYFDKRGKTNGILYTSKVTFPAYAENGSQMPLIPFVNVKINHVPPDWAYSFDFYFTKENTQYLFWQTKEVNKDETEYIYLDITSLNTNATKKPTTANVLSYAFQDGDRVRFLRDTDTPGIVFNDTYDAAIEGDVTDPKINNVDKTGRFLKIKNIEPFTTGIDSAKNYVIEIFRPAQQIANSENQVYYEFGRQYPILNPTLPTRSHAGEVTDQVVGTTPAEFNFYEGDAYFRGRTILTAEGAGYATFNVMDRNFVDFYISAVSSIDGRPNIIDLNARRQYYSTLIRFGQAYQANTNINGLNRFYPNNFDEYDYNYGDVLRIKVRDRYLKVFQKFKIGVAPLYSEISKDASGNAINVVTDKLLNKIQYRIGNFGLTNPESLASWHYSDYGVDTNKGVVWRDSNDGVLPISELYKVNSWATKELPLRTGNYKIYGAIEPKSNRGQYVLVLEVSGSTSAQTIIFSEDTNSFESYVSFQPEMMCTLGTTLISFKTAALHTHDDTAFNTFFGTTYDSYIDIVFNKDVLQTKSYLSIDERSNQIWPCPLIETSMISYGSTPQQSNLLLSDFENVEGKWFARFLQDLNSIGGVANGEQLKGQWVKIRFRVTSPTSLLTLNEVLLKYIDSPNNQ